MDSSEARLLDLRTGDERGTSTTHPKESEHHQETSVDTGLEASPGFSASCLTTAELQQHWRAVKQEIRCIKLLFEIPSTRTIEQATSRYVVYKIVVIRSGSYDGERVAIERRYSDFLHLHHQLLQDFSEELEDISLPRKKLVGNFSEENIAERRVALCDYLTQLYSLRYIRRSPAFIAFFTHSELKAAHDLLRGGRFSQALEILQSALVLQEKLSTHDATLLVPTLCALVVCQRDLQDFHAAFKTGHRALPAVRRYGLSKYRAPLLEAMVDLGYKMEQPVAQLQAELIKVQNSPREQISLVSLKELVVQEFT
ncbi:sorting nexin-20 [Astyanax mexicanus]|uniref:Sorting nexin 20 n=1 Tax=Astyanax mexicanus TaxID=7994 RepID=W5LEG7_ASTMX|nr:sorting nexin-20 [Astyanax mexicanus]